MGRVTVRFSWVLLLVFGLSGAITIAGALRADEGGGDSSAKKPLDLPSGGAGSSEEEDAAEVIRFYGAEYEANAFFWLLDRSGSMQGTAMATLKQEMREAINQLPKRSEFGVASFADDTSYWRDRPMRATTANKTNALIYVESMQALGWTCMPDGVVRICQIANQCRKRNKTIICVGDGVPRCGSMDNILDQATLDAFAANNPRRTKVNTIFISSLDMDHLGIALFTQIALTYRGTFVQVAN